MNTFTTIVAAVAAVSFLSVACGQAISVAPRAPAAATAITADEIRLEALSRPQDPQTDGDIIVQFGSEWRSPNTKRHFVPSTKIEATGSFADESATLKREIASLK